ncbi:hypothetical protein BJ742DRAFT_735853 [Cladochytrium replicatum]|nr:hypothetical protein BJ742DRAFT_735853 [Cladochytrium replicatum]
MAIKRRHSVMNERLSPPVDQNSPNECKRNFGRFSKRAENQLWLVLSGAIWIVVRKLTSTALIEKKKQSWVKVSTPVGSEQAVVGVCAGHPQFDTKVRVNDSILLEFSALDIHEEEVAGEYCERRLDRVWISPETVLSWSTP